MSHAWQIFLIIALLLSQSGVTVGDSATATSVITVVTYDPDTLLLQVMFQDGLLVSHRQVPQELYDEFNGVNLAPSFYEEIIVPAYPPLEPDPFHEEDLGPIDEDYVNALAEIPPATLQLCERAVRNAIMGGSAALRECERLETRAVNEFDDVATRTSAFAKNIILQTRSAAIQAEQRMARKEYKQAHKLVERSAQDLQRLISSLAPAIQNASSVSIREQHQAAHYINNYSMLMEHANKALRVLRNAVEVSESDAKKIEDSNTDATP